tara:strand:- start:69 stop:632 length:564 start_codon:yes stop_codon:yes gene_type:complete
MLIWNSNIKLPQNLHDGIIDVIEKNYIDKEKYYTSYYEDKFSDLLLPYYSNLVKHIMKDLGIFKISKYRYNIWVQMYNSETTTHTPHGHFTGTEIISFTHIINASKEKCFYFLDDYNNKIYPNNQQNGDIFAWPSWLIHGADNVKEPDINRLIVAGNISLKKLYNLDGSIRTECIDEGNNKYVWMGR